MRFGSRGPRKFLRPSPGRSSRIRHRNALTERAWKDAVQGLGNALSRSRVTISAGKQDNYPIDFMNINGHSKLKSQGRLLRFELLHFAR